MRIEGGCHCSAVRFKAELPEPPVAALDCNCSVCRMTGFLHIVVPHGAHGLSGLQNIECLDGLIRQFIETASVKGLDTACIKTIKRQGFQLHL